MKKKKNKKKLKNKPELNSKTVQAQKRDRKHGKPTMPHRLRHGRGVWRRRAAFADRMHFYEQAFDVHRMREDLQTLRRPRLSDARF